MSTSSTLGRNDLESLLRAISGIETQTLEIAQRRSILLLKLAEMISAVGGFWGWGRGRPGITTVSPLASIPFGFSESEWVSVAQFCLSPEGQRLCQEPIFARMHNTMQVTVGREDLMDDDTWYSSQSFLQTFRPARLDHMMSTVRFCTPDTWCCLTFIRRLDMPAFQRRDLDLIDLAVAGTIWLHPQLSESIPPQLFAEITPRQRLVMLFLLDGMSRKQIANNLGLTLHTVNDHVKALYARFEVQSATELAARFLKSV